MGEPAGKLPHSGGAATYERPLDQAVPASAWRAILADDERVTLRTSLVQLIRTIRDSSGD